MYVIVNKCFIVYAGPGQIPNGHAVLIGIELGVAVVDDFDGEVAVVVDIEAEVVGFRFFDFVESYDFALDDVAGGVLDVDGELAFALGECEAVLECQGLDASGECGRYEAARRGGLAIEGGGQCSGSADELEYRVRIVISAAKDDGICCSPSGIVLVCSVGFGQGLTVVEGVEIAFVVTGGSGRRIRVGGAAAFRVEFDVVYAPGGVVGILGGLVAEGDVYFAFVFGQIDVAALYPFAVFCLAVGSCCRSCGEGGFELGGCSEVGRVGDDVDFERGCCGSVAVDLGVKGEGLVGDFVHVDGGREQPLVEGRGALESGHGDVVVLVEVADIPRLVAGHLFLEPSGGDIGGGVEVFVYRDHGVCVGVKDCCQQEQQQA